MVGEFARAIAVCCNGVITAWLPGIVVVVAVALAPAASAQGSGALEVTVSPTTIPTGASVTVSGTGCGPNVRVVVTSPSGGPGGLVDEIVADAAGAFTDVFDFPEEVVGSTEDTAVNVFCNDSEGTQQSVTIEILIRPVELPFTGIPTWAVLVVAAVSLMVGALLVSLGTDLALLAEQRHSYRRVLP